jgi:hypothetical protein
METNLLNLEKQKCTDCPHDKCKCHESKDDCSDHKCKCNWWNVVVLVTDIKTKTNKI